MRIALILALSLAACIDQDPLPINRAVSFVTFAEASADCLALDTGRKGLPDTAICRIKGALVYCAGPEGGKPACEPFAETKGAPPRAEAPAP